MDHVPDLNTSFPPRLQIPVAQELSRAPTPESVQHPLALASSLGLCPIAGIQSHSPQPSDRPLNQTGHLVSARLSQLIFSPSSAALQSGLSAPCTQSSPYPDHLPIPQGKSGDHSFTHSAEQYLRGLRVPINLDFDLKEETHVLAKTAPLSSPSETERAGWIMKLILCEKLS